MSGLGRGYWKEVIDVLRSIIPVYDKVNRAISMGNDTRYRRLGLHGRIQSGDTILDAGSGYGNMSRIAIHEAKGNAKIVLYDPIPEMLENVAIYFGPEHCPALLSGIFEFMPFKNNTFDAVTCGYSLRDAIRLKDAISEMHRVLKNGGRLIIIDLGKPDNLFLRFLVSSYLRYFLPVFAFAAAGRLGLKFKTLHGTYLRWPTNSELHALLEEKFGRIEFEKKMMGGAVIVAAYK